MDDLVQEVSLLCELPPTMMTFTRPLEVGMEVVIIAVLVVVVVTLWALMISAVVDAARTPTDRWRLAGRGKGATIFLIILTGGFGGAYYWWRIRPDLRAGAPAGGQPAAPPLSKAERRAIEAHHHGGR